MHLKNVEISREILDEFLALNLVHRTMKKIDKGEKEEELENSLGSSQRTSRSDLWNYLNNNFQQGIPGQLHQEFSANPSFQPNRVIKPELSTEPQRSNFHIWSQYVNYQDNHSSKRFYSPCLHYENIAKPRTKRRMRSMDKEKNVRDGQIKQIWKQLNVQSEKYVPSNIQNSVKKLNILSEKYIPKNFSN
jgi:hypothetical protein